MERDKKASVKYLSQTGKVDRSARQKLTEYIIQMTMQGECMITL